MSESFTNQKPRIATEEECKAPWSGYRDGRNFRCKLCGHRFKEGDGWRWLYGKGITTNFMVCAQCDNDNDDALIARMEALIEESKQKFWWLWTSLDAAEGESSRPMYVSCPRCKEEFRA